MWANVDRRFFRTSEGYIRFGPAKCQPGDYIVVLTGGDVPYIFRPLSTSHKLSRACRYLAGKHENALSMTKQVAKTWYTILGDSYVHGIMDGDAFSILNEKNRKLRDIVLV